MDIWEIFRNYYQYFLRGTVTTVIVSLITVLFGFILGCVIALLRMSKSKLLSAFGNEFITMIKETSIIQYLGIGDLMYNNGIVVTSTYNPLPCYYISAIIYLALNIILGKGLNIFEGRLRKSER